MQNIDETSSGSNAQLEPYYIRITSSGKIRAWVQFALDFFEVCISTI